MKKLLIDANPIVPYYVAGRVNGIGRTTLELIQALAKVENLPFEVTLYSQNMKGIGGRNANLPFKNRHIYLRNTEFCNKFAAKLRLREVFTQYDLMHITHNFEYVAHPEKCIVTLHDAFFMKIEDAWADMSKMRIQTPPFIQRCKHILTCSESSKRDIVETMGVPDKKVTVIYWGCDHQNFYVCDDKQAVKQHVEHRFGLKNPYFFTLSCNPARKRADQLVHAYLTYCESQKKVKNDLVLIWGDAPQQVLDEVAASRFADRVHFLSNVTNEDLRNLYNGATASFTPSMYEGFGLPILESMACGCPVVSARNSSLVEVGEDAVIYSDEPILETIPAIMRAIETGEIDLEEYKKKGVVQAAKFTWEKTAQKTIQVYTRLLS